MARLQNLQVKIVAAMTICTMLLATFYLAKPVEGSNKIATQGEITILQEDGKTELTAISFPLFIAGTPAIHTKSFIIKNTGKHTVHICWTITASTIKWNQIKTHHKSGYEHLETGIQKYTFRILQETRYHRSVAAEHPAIVLEAGKTTRLLFELSYSGTPFTAETFSITIAFTTMRNPPER